MIIEELVQKTIKDSISKFFYGKDVKVEHVLDLIFPRERRVRSLIGGLETSLGTRLWEPLAKAFAESNNFKVLDEKRINQKVPTIPEQVRHFISDFESKKKVNPSLEHAVFYRKLRGFIRDNDISPDTYQRMPKGEGIDVWLVRDGTEYLIDIKTTQLNAGGGPKFNSNLLNWYAYRALEKSRYDVKCLLAFPFNPHKGKDFWVKERGKVSPLIPSKEAIVGDEFWDFLLGKSNSTKMIFDEFKKLGKDNFGDQFADIFYPTKQRSP